jgi:hypothetical protein
MDDRDLERLLARYRPADPPADLRAHALARAPIGDAGRTWPWAVAAAALLAISVGLHAATVDGPPAPAPVDPMPLAQQLGGDEAAVRMAAFMIASSPAPPVREPSAPELLWIR